MSREELRRFRQDLRANPELKENLQQARQSAIQQATQVFAANSGYGVSLEDFNKSPAKKPMVKGKKKAKRSRKDKKPADS